MEGTNTTRLAPLADKTWRNNVPAAELLFYNNKESVMGLILFVLLLALLFGGLGFAAHSLWIVAVVVFFGWLIGFGMRMGEGSRWYRW